MTRGPIHVLRLAAEPEAVDALSAELADRWGQFPAVSAPPGGNTAWLELYFDDPAEAALVQACLAPHPGIRRAELDRTSPEDWEAAFRGQFTQFTVGRRLRICPEWERDSAPRDERVNLWVDPGLSFGTGRHFTTRFCLAIIDQLWLESAFCSFLDVGTGSGLLAIAAARLGCARVVAWENDVAVIPYTQRNLAANECLDRVALSAQDLRDAAVTERFDLVCANLISGLILDGADRLLGLAARRLAVTGILAGECDAVAAAFARRGARLLQREGDGEWSGLLFEVAAAGAGPAGKGRS